MICYFLEQSVGNSSKNLLTVSYVNITLEWILRESFLYSLKQAFSQHPSRSPYGHSGRGSSQLYYDRAMRMHDHATLFYRDVIIISKPSSCA